MKLKDWGVNMEQKIAIFRRGEGREEFFFERGKIIYHVHKFTEITGTLKMLKKLVDKGVN